MSAQPSRAYDYEGYGEYYEFEEAVVAQPLELRVYQKKGISKELTGQLISSVAIIASLLVMLIYSNITLTELSDQVSTQRSEYEILKSESRRMMVELEGTVSLRNIEESAVATMGMAPVEPYQVEYVDLGGGDKIEVVSSKIDPLLTKLKAVVETFTDYVGL